MVATGGLTTVAFDPGVPVGFSGTAISVEVGGHTLVYTKSGSTQFCYVGHFTNRSMGDGTSGNNGGSAATSLKHDCSSTPALAICGYVPVAASTSTSTIAASKATIPADGSSTSVITTQLKDASGNNLTSSGGVVSVNSTNGTLGTVTDNNDGKYSVLLTSSNTASTAIVSYFINGAAASATTSVLFSTVLSLNWQNVFAYRENNLLKIEWSTSLELNIGHFDVERSLNAQDWVTVISNLPAANLSIGHTYRQVDHRYEARAVYYRIKETALSGKFSYSAIVRVAAE